MDVRVSKSVLRGQSLVSGANSYQCDVVVEMSETVPDGVADQEYLIALDVSRLKAVGIIATQPMTLKTNSAGAPQETIPLAANVPVVWEEGDAALFAGDVTAVYISNASGNSGTFKLLAGSAN